MHLSRIQKIYFNNSLKIGLLAGFLTVIIKTIFTSKFVMPEWFFTFGAGFLGGFTISVFEDFYADQKLKKYKFAKALLIRAIVYSTIIKICYFLDMLADPANYEISLLEKLFQWESLSEYWAFIIEFGIPILVLFLFVTVFSLAFQVNKMLGTGVLKNFITGRYHQPKSEKRIFMFLDLKSSTSIAERLGHVEYSKFLQEFFLELDEAIIETKGKLYQYVGDEIVMIWRYDQGFKDNNCVKFFFLVEQRIDEIKKKFFDKFGVFPEYKAGLHCGEVSIAQIGSIKRDIAYHGDPMNTTARICGTCNKVDKRFLISKDILDNIILNGDFKIEDMGEFLLRGKRKPIELYSIDK